MFKVEGEMEGEKSLLIFLLLFHVYIHVYISCDHSYSIALKRTNLLALSSALLSYDLNVCTHF